MTAGATRRRNQGSRNDMSANSKRRLALLSLLAAGALANDTPAIQLQSALPPEPVKSLRKQLYKYSDVLGFLATNKLDPGGEDMQRLRNTLADQPQGLLTETDTPIWVVDTGASGNTTSDELDFVPGTLQRFTDSNAHSIEGIAGNIPIEGEGTVELELVSDEGHIYKLRTPAYYVPKLTRVRTTTSDV